MIIGVGTDFVDIRRIGKLIDRFGERFLSRLFTEEERRCAGRVSHTVSRLAIYAKRFALKEACAKSLGTGLTCGILWREIETVEDNLGQPKIHLTGNAAMRLMKITPNRMVARINVTVTDEYPLAQAFVLISATPIADQRVSGRCPIARTGECDDRP